ncbi:protein containing phage integrase catalytic core domain [Sulfurimonas gotlandica GD1]|uniref:Protein containing phage integrase catalytic core domain n=1 Tax=Sulfurimonas gotlandica (strain DSM 19862 / JCM 16533 / GD1) TaxID=929558 RepID=B6BM50_SULGG|nr:tyrosine-type recombinase/integrase [Sulfurimonas gotlandica]EDZ61818.1 phage integrase, putative [Sulfurimonas gotlandica GD1]EHP29372.1 protein containing phage integrase catalytic core domain [Sulfurimonas gotlandica GD1]
MAMKYNLEITKYKNIYSLKKDNGKDEYYTTFMLKGITYQKKNLTAEFNATTAKQASETLEFIKSEIREGREPFQSNGGDKVRNIILNDIATKKPKNKGGDNSHYKRSLELFFNKYINPTIGHLTMENVKDSHIKKILNSLEGNTKSYKLTVNVLMLKIFENAFRKGAIKTNPFYDLDYGTHEPKAEFDIRLNEDMEDTAKKIYNATINFDMSHRLLFLLSIMSVRRIGEIWKLRFSHFKKYSDGSWYVLATKDITKTGIEEKYPIPLEVVELLPEEVLDDEYKDEKLFHFCYSGMFLKEAKLIKNAKVEINKGYKITSHDNRNLFISILSSLGIDSDLADRCLSHNNKKNIKQVYLDVPYKKRKEIFEKWWNFLRAK